MGKKDKLVERFCSLPKDFTWQELKRLLQHFGFEQSNAGKTSGSRVRFYCPGYEPVLLHRPHPSKIIKQYQLVYIKEYLEIVGLL